MAQSVFKRARRLVPFGARVEFFRARRALVDSLSRSNFCVRGNPSPGSSVVFAHKAKLVRDYPEPWYSLQKNKIVNLTLAAQKIDRTIVRSGDTFSFWRAVGRTSKRKGYLAGMTIADGTLTESNGGGLCQLSNALYWMALHLGFTITERHRHSFDVFPDSYRSVPFGAGATVFYNYVDLRFTNTTGIPYMINVRLDDEYLHVEASTMKKMEPSYRVVEENHRFVEAEGEIFRENDLFREEILGGKIVSRELIAHNRGKVLYHMQQMPRCYD